MLSTDTTIRMIGLIATHKDFSNLCSSKNGIKKRLLTKSIIFSKHGDLHITNLKKVSKNYQAHLKRKQKLEKDYTRNISLKNLTQVIDRINILYVYINK